MTNPALVLRHVGLDREGRTLLDDVNWTVKPGQRITPRVHPSGTDTWTIVSGQGDYIADLSDTKRPVKAGDVAVARAGEVHGVHNSGAVPLVFIAVVAPVEAGYHVA